MITVAVIFALVGLVFGMVVTCTMLICRDDMPPRSNALVLAWLLSLIANAYVLYNNINIKEVLGL